MKIFTIKLLALVTSALLLGACSQMATYENEDLTNSLEKADQAGFVLNPYGTSGFENAMTLDGGGDYTVDCITETTGDEFKSYGSLSGQWGNPQNPNEKTLMVEVWNTLTTIEYRFTLTSDGQTGGNLQYYDEVLVDWVNLGSLTIGTTYPVSRALPIGWVAGDVITEQWRNTGGGGSPLEAGDVSYTLIGECIDCDDESFSYVATNENLHVVFSYDAASELTDAVVQFTFPQIMGMTLDENEKYTAPDEKMYSVNNATNQTVFTWVGDIGCSDATATTFEFDFSPDCGAGNANDGQARIWADTKVNGLSVKNTNTPNIDYLGCSIPE
ncbi:hypothetical protein [Algoriphagus persicinus]|uniref:hypothetical protein n=1 Tax=Algoriphagus persicinus TaxID=3108754 RepID=UPI002B39D1F6|nr:hypothetical protein [Algoriphagus sp. E1-3-M2]MEB2783174.1 hypothetical protein [Algoriphagus sp. E1-3-M2]